MENNKRRKRSQIIYICCKPMVATIMTGFFAKRLPINSVLIGIILGIAAAIECYFDIKRLLGEEDERLSDKEKDFLIKEKA